MQAYHRRRHRIFWLVIAVVVPIAILIALMGRKGIPHHENATAEETVLSNREDRSPITDY